MKTELLLFDTHLHPKMIEEKSSIQTKVDFSIEDVMIEAERHGVQKFLFIGTNLEENIYNIKLAEKNTNRYVALGIHPCDVANESWEKINNFFESELIKNSNIIKAIGETGIDLFHDSSTFEKQNTWFHNQINLALKHNLPICIHSRNSMDETLKVIDEYTKHQLSGIIHCFGENLNYAKEWTRRGFLLGIGSYIEYPKNISLRESLVSFGIKEIVLETDSPFLPPQELRGKVNTPKNILKTANFIANLLKITTEEVAIKTTRNAINKLKLEA